MKNYSINVSGKKNIYPSTLKLGGTNPDGTTISFMNYYMEMNNKPNLAVVGEFHYSRCASERWEDEINKMKMAGVTIIATYLFWNHHEEEKGIFDFTGRRNIRKFIELCAMHKMWVIARIGPFCHGEVRNGGFPDWLFGSMVKVRSNDPEYLHYTKRLYNEYGKQLQGLLFKNNGPVIGIQLENEYQSASSPWEMNIGQGDEWIVSGDDGVEHMRNMKELAVGAGFEVPIYTCTGWGGAPILMDEILPLYGAYAYWPWVIQYGDEGAEHELTGEYIFRNYHDNVLTLKFDAVSNTAYEPERYPFACCEMGGGMQSWYKSRFIVLPESVDCITIQKLAGGCNFLGYYMYHGGSNPVGKHSFLNENTCPKISYDFQAPLSEFGQVRDSCRRLKLIHYFTKQYGELLSPMGVFNPEGSEKMQVDDLETLRWAVRAEEDKGFVFVLNYQDHAECFELEGIKIHVNTPNESIAFPTEGTMIVEKGRCLILPFNLSLGHVNIKAATAQPLTNIRYNNEDWCFFFVPSGLNGEYLLRSDSDLQTEGCEITNRGTEYLVKVPSDRTSLIKAVNGNETINIVTLTHEQALHLWKYEMDGQEYVANSNAMVMADGRKIKLEHTGHKNLIYLSMFPAPSKGQIQIDNGVIQSTNQNLMFSDFIIQLPEFTQKLDIDRRYQDRMLINVAKEAFEVTKDLLIRVKYEGDVGRAFINGNLIADNFCNGDVWEFALKENKDEIMDNGILLLATAHKSGRVESHSEMAALKVAEQPPAKIDSIDFVPVREINVIF